MNSSNLKYYNIEKIKSKSYKCVAGRLITQADEIINMGLILQKNFVDRIFEDIDEETKDAIYSGISKMNSNLNEILEEVQ